ncbi:hypothetical protein ACLG6S_02795 [Thermodesulfobacteriota bacterium B35]
MTTPRQHQEKKPCPACGGTGQISFFQGESRFLLTSEECPVCFGLGYLLPDNEQPDDSDRGESPQSR